MKENINRFYRYDSLSQFSLDSVSKNIPNRIIRLLGIDKRRIKLYKVRVYVENGTTYDYSLSRLEFDNYTPLPIFGGDEDLKKARKIGKLDKIK